jgi:hypothetical protein
LNCRWCETEVSTSEVSCRNCGKPLANPKEADPALAKAISWALVVMGVLGLIFVIVNSGQSWHTALDYIAPVAVLAIGLIALNIQSRRRW